MMYDIDGNPLSVVYDIDGNSLAQAYDIDGNPLIPMQTDLVVMSYNVQWFTGINSDQTMQKSIIDTYQADIIGLQEVSALPSVSSGLFEDYNYSYLGVQSNKTAIVSKPVLANVSAGTFTNQAGETRGYQKAYFEHDGKTICWINAHLATSGYEAAKVAQAGELFNMVANEQYFIITGDFNTVCKSVNDTEYTTIMKQFIDAGYHSANCSNQHGFLNTWTDGTSLSDTWYPCDHVITSANIYINNVVVDTTKIDVAAQTGQTIDHLPIIAELSIV